VSLKSIPPLPQPAANPLRETREKLEQAEACRREGKLDRAETICSALLQRYPDYVAALHTLGLIYADRGDLKRAVGPLFRAAMLNPRSWMTLTALSGLCLSLDGKEMAAQILEQARLINPRDASVLVTLGEIYREEREYELGREAFREALTQEQGLEPAVVGLALCHMSLGENAEAAAVLNELLKTGFRSFRLLSVLAQLPPAMIDINILGEITKLTKHANDDPIEFENSIAFIRAIALDKAERYGEAWEVLRAANRTRAGRMKQELKELKEGEQFALKRLRDARGLSHTSLKEQTASLFILGPSRSGKTSLETLFGRLEGAKRGYENPSLDNAISRTFQNAGLLTQWSLDQLPPQFLPDCRGNYLEELTRRAGPARVFSNTGPMNVHHASYMATLLGSARFIFVKRNNNDVMFRIYMRNYREGHAYAYNLNSIRDHLNWYNQMADLMLEQFPDIVRTVHYEDMVSNPRDAMRVVAELCDLPMPEGPVPAIGDDRGCAEPYRNLMASELGQATSA
jgi:tetratricopeptide (TPR) repeat protein